MKEKRLKSQIRDEDQLSIGKMPICNGHFSSKLNDNFFIQRRIVDLPIKMKVVKGKKLMLLNQPSKKTKMQNMQKIFSSIKRSYRSCHWLNEEIATYAQKDSFKERVLKDT